MKSIKELINDSIFSKKKCCLCNKNKRTIMNIPVYCDIMTLENDKNKTLDHMECCKNCVYDLYKKEMLMISYKMCIKNTILENITKFDLSDSSKRRLSILQDVIITENNNSRRLSIISHSTTIISPVKQYLP
jgi:hypothetical protein